MKSFPISLAFAAAALALVAPRAMAQTTAAPQAVMAKECGACHMVYPASQLPARSWTKLMGGLASHFGENAALDPATTQTITALLTANAGDVSGNRRLRGLAASETPLRITETPGWIRSHRKITAAEYATVKVKSRSNCIACHVGAAQGVFEGDED
jgi:hypothetical protein